MRVRSRLMAEQATGASAQHQGTAGVASSTSGSGTAMASGNVNDSTPCSMASSIDPAEPLGQGQKPVVSGVIDLSSDDNDDDNDDAAAVVHVSPPSGSATAATATTTATPAVGASSAADAICPLVASLPAAASISTGTAIGSTPPSAFPGVDCPGMTHPDDPDASNPKSLQPSAGFVAVDATWINDGHKGGGVRSALMVRRAHEPPRQKVAGFDFDGVLMRWLQQWANDYHQYAMWNAYVPCKLRRLHAAGYKLVIFANKGNIQGAFLTGANATRIRGITDWLAHVVRVPLHAVFSTKKGGGYHKPATGMWAIMEQYTNGGTAVDIASSFLVCETESDRQFARSIGEERGATMGIEAPDVHFGPPAGVHIGSARWGQAGGDVQGTLAALGVEEVSEEALAARRALLGSYMQGPRMIVLCGPQGSGKSHFCTRLVEASRAHGSAWVVTCQDTVKNGKPGDRHVCERMALEALQRGQCVVVDRTHVDPSQRFHFLQVGCQAGVPVDAVLLLPPLAEMQRRVHERVNHPGGVQGAEKIGIVTSTYNRLVPPSRAEGFALVTRLETPDEVERLTQLYAHVQPRPLAAVSQLGAPSLAALPTVSPPLRETFPLGALARPLPSILLGTMNIKNPSVLAAMLRAGFCGVDTAPTYVNEENVGAAMQAVQFYPHVTCKVPHRATTAAQVRSELSDSLRKLKVAKTNLLLLHWPSKPIENGMLEEIWKEMEAAVAAGRAEALGVCNFTQAALQTLLPFCTIRPVVNQVERHPMLPQWALLECCIAHRIVLQAHTPLGQGTAAGPLGHAVVRSVAVESGLTPAQVLLQWNLRHGVAVVPKCSTDDHATQLLSATRVLLSGAQMAQLDAIVPAGQTGTRILNVGFMKGSTPKIALYGW